MTNCNKCGAEVKGFYNGRCEDCFAEDMDYALESRANISTATRFTIVAIKRVKPDAFGGSKRSSSFQENS